MGKEGIYKTIYGKEYDLASLTKGETRLYSKIKGFYEKNPHWNVFSNYWNKGINSLYKPKTRKDRKKIIKSSLFKICQDLESRLGIKQGYVRPTSPKDLLEEASNPFL